MRLYQIISLMITLAALFSYINYRYIKLPNTIGVMLIGMVMSLGLIGLEYAGLQFHAAAQEIVKAVPFEKALMQGMLSFLLFAGALHINLADLLKVTKEVTILATIGVVLSMFFFGTALYFILQILGIELSYAYCLLFGALISPTDPVAVVGILKDAKAPKRLETIIAGESLFNDGVGVVLFIILLQVATGEHEASFRSVALLFLQEAGGGLLFGLAIGGVAFVLLKSVDQYQVEIMLTLALVAGGYALAEAIHVSAPLAVVAAGLLIGNHGREYAMSDKTQEHLDDFWQLLDEILNTVLFLFVGLEVLVFAFPGRLLLCGVLIIPVLLFCRWASVALPALIMRGARELPFGSIAIMTWGGLRGGISVAMALGLPEGAERNVILPLTYMIVVFSILAQGLTVERLIKRVSKQSAPAAA